MKTRAREIKLAIKAKVLDAKHCAWNCPALDRRAPFGIECMRLWHDAQNIKLKLDELDLPPLRCTACRRSEIKE